MNIFDITIPISNSMPVWPGDPGVISHQIASIENGDQSNVTQIQMSVHTGTHIDAPRHFIDNGKTVDQIPLEKLIGEVLVMVIDEGEAIISDQVLKAHPKTDLLRQSRKVLFRTKNSSLWKYHPDKFQTDYIGIDASGAAYLGNLNLDLIGIDYLSIAPYTDTLQPHTILLSNDIILLEGLDLSNVPGGIYELYCLPLIISGCEGAPARVVLIKR
jgi:arylformamidase